MNILKKYTLLFFLATLFIIHNAFAVIYTLNHGTPPESTIIPSPHGKILENLEPEQCAIEPFSVIQKYDNLHHEYYPVLQLNKPTTDPIYMHSPTLAYAGIQHFNKHIFCDQYYPNIKYDIMRIGCKNIEKIVNKFTKNEARYHKTHYSFCHGQKREFQVSQDIFTRLYEKFNREKLIDFCFLRIPNKIFDKFLTIDEFISHYKTYILTSSYPHNVFDNHIYANKHILSVNTNS